MILRQWRRLSPPSFRRTKAYRRRSRHPPYRLTTAKQFREFPDNIDFFVLEPQVKQMEDLGWRYLEQHLDLELSLVLKAAIDPISFGRQAMEENRGCFTKYGYLSLSGDEW